MAVKNGYKTIMRERVTSVYGLRPHRVLVPAQQYWPQGAYLSI